MTEKQNVQMVSDAYAAFVRGDIPALLKTFTADIDWHVPGPVEAPYAGRRRGLDEANRFFADVARIVEFTKFEPREYVAQGDRVIALGHYEGRIRTTGKPFSADWAMAWRLRDGLLAEFHEYTDTQALGNAYR